MDDVMDLRFKTLEYNELDKCAQLLSSVFSLYDPFIVLLEITKEQLYAIIVRDLNTIINDNLITICLNKTDEVVGCYAGFKLSKLDLFENDNKLNNTITVKGLKTLEERLSLLDLIDFTLLKPFYEQHKKDDELDKAIFCDYFCIHEDYFKTKLAKQLAFEFFTNCHKNGIKHIYGSFFNEKAMSLLTKYFDARVVNTIKVKFEENDLEYKVYLLYGHADMFAKMKAKF
jgi:hypothetical protein